MATYKIETIIYNGVATICGKDIVPKGIGTFIRSWTDGEGKVHTKISIIYSTLHTNHSTY